MLTELFGRATKPVNLYGRYSHPLYFSPSFAILSLASLIFFRWWTSIPTFESLLPAWVEWSILVVFLAIPMSLMAGLAPYAMVKLHERWGYASVQCTVLSLCLVFILALWANPNKEVSPLPIFFQVAGVVGTLSLFLWPAMKRMGTRHDPEGETHSMWN